MSARRFALGVLIASALAGCASAPVPRAPANRAALPDGTTPAQIVAAIRAAGTAAEDELAVQPLRANEVEHLRTQAATYEASGEPARAAAALDQALAAHDADPTVLQERAEVAVLLWDFDAAAAFARRAIGQGAGVGPLCRRHWATLEQIARARLADSSLRTTAGSRKEAQARDDAAARTATQARSDLDHARQQREACTVAPPPRY